MISRHLGWSETLSEWVSIVDTLLNGQQLLWGGHGCVGVHDPFHSRTPTAVCLGCRTKNKINHFQLASQEPTKDCTTRCPVLMVLMPWQPAVPRAVTQENPSQKTTCYYIYLVSVYLICCLTTSFMYTMYSERVEAEKNLPFHFFTFFDNFIH